MNDFLQRLRSRKLVQWALAYLAGAWVLLQVIGLIGQQFDWPQGLLRGITVAAGVGFFVTLVLAWYHGERGVQKVSGTELLLLALLLGIGGGLLWKFVPTRGQEASGSRAGARATASRSDSAAVSAPLPASDKSIAVLPFNDMSPEHDQEYFSDGMAEEILNALAQVQDLKVAGRTSSFSFKGKNEKLPAIGAALGVANVLEGSVRKQGSKVRITAQLIRADNGFHLWSQTYDGELTDVFELQEHIARAITDALKVVLEGDLKTHLAQQTTQNVEAYQQYLRGIYFFNRRGYKNMVQSVAAFKAALALDPGYADAWAGLAQTLAIFDNFALVESDRKDWKASDPEALAAAEQALRLQPDSSTALVARALVRTHQFDWAGAEADHRAAIAASPRNPVAHLWYGEFLMYQQRWHESGAQMEQALALDPLSPITHYGQGWLRDSQGDFTGALPHHDEALRLEPGFYVALANKVEDLVDLRRYEAAMATAQELPEPQRLAFLGVIAALQDPARVGDAVKQLKAHPLGGTDQSWALTEIGKHDLALAELERMFRERDPTRVYMLDVYVFKALHGDARFQALVQQMKLPESTPDNAAAKP